MEPVPEGLTKASRYSSMASQFRFSASASCARGESKFRLCQPAAMLAGLKAPMKATCNIT
ncbi:hypothetical protein D3C75_526960 [compost metagenome]